MKKDSSTCLNKRVVDGSNFHTNNFMDDIDNSEMRILVSLELQTIFTGIVICEEDDFFIFNEDIKLMDVYECISHEESTSSVPIQYISTSLVLQRL